MTNQAEILLSTVQNLRGYLTAHPQARSTIDLIAHTWLPVELFPPERSVIVQALNVLINAGELEAIGPTEYRVYCAKSPLDNVAGY